MQNRRVGVPGGSQRISDRPGDGGGGESDQPTRNYSSLALVTLSAELVIAGEGKVLVMMPSGPQQQLEPALLRLVEALIERA